MSRISRLFAERGDQKLLIPFFTSGFPNHNITKQLVLASVESGADMVEIGFPFSDPLADGPSIQYSSQIALQSGSTLEKTLELVSQLRKETQLPFVLMGHINPVLAYGIDAFCSDASAAGVDGLIIPDLPVDEAGELEISAIKHKISLTFLASPTSQPSRLRLVDRHSTDFVYAVTVAGVTGARKLFDPSTDTYLRALRSRLTKPFVAGFGVSGPDSAKRLSEISDGVVIGSALVEIIRKEFGDSNQVNAVKQFLVSIRKAIG